MPSYRYRQVVVIGVGLLGGSIGMALRQRGLAKRVVGVGRNPQSLELALARGAICEAQTDLSVACSSADLIVVATPVQLIADWIKRCCQVGLPSDCIITDVGSTKATICQQLDDQQHNLFCGSHPMAGSEKSGVSHATNDLLDGKRTILTPTPRNPEQIVERIEQFWQSIGSLTLRMSPEQHDQAVAHISHLPHVIAASLAAMTDRRLLYIAGKGWSDTTRVAAGDVELWRQIIVENRQPLLTALGEYSRSLSQWIAAIGAEDDRQLVELLQQGKNLRDSASTTQDDS